MLKSFGRSGESEAEKNSKELKDQFLILETAIRENMDELRSNLEEEWVEFHKAVKSDVSNAEIDLGHKVNSLDTKLTYLVDATEKKLMHEIEKIGLKITIRMAGVLTAGVVLVEALHRIFPGFK